MNDWDADNFEDGWEDDWDTPKDKNNEDDWDIPPNGKNNEDDWEDNWDTPKDKNEDRWEDDWDTNEDDTNVDDSNKIGNEISGDSNTETNIVAEKMKDTKYVIWAVIIGIAIICISLFIGRVVKKVQERVYNKDNTVDTQAVDNQDKNSTNNGNNNTDVNVNNVQHKDNNTNIDGYTDCNGKVWQVIDSDGLDFSSINVVDTTLDIKKVNLVCNLNNDVVNLECVVLGDIVGLDEVVNKEIEMRVNPIYYNKLKNIDNIDIRLGYIKNRDRYVVVNIGLR